LPAFAEPFIAWLQSSALHSQSRHAEKDD